MMNERNEGASMEGMSSMGRMWHWACCILPVVSCILWVAAIVFVVLSWVSVMNESGEIAGYGPQWWIWNAVMFGILALYGGRRKMGCHCGICMHDGSMH